MSGLVAGRACLFAYMQREGGGASGGRRAHSAARIREDEQRAALLGRGEHHVERARAALHDEQHDGHTLRRRIRALEARAQPNLGTPFGLVGAHVDQDVVGVVRVETPLHVARLVCAHNQRARGA
jgi:hypothetical protein